MSDSPVLIDQETEPRGSLSLSGTVVGADGLGVAGANVLLDSVPARNATTGEAGTFSFDGLIPRSYVVRASSRDSWGVAGVRLTREAQLVTVHLQPGVTLTLGVVDSLHGKPVAGAHVVAGELSATTSAHGDAVLRPVTPGFVDIRISAAGYASVGMSPFVSVAPQNRIEVRMGRGHAIAGIVVDEQGTPVPDAAIFVLGDYAVPLVGDKLAAATDEDGRFRATDVPAGVRRVFAIDARHAPATTGPLVVERDLFDVVVTVKQGSRLQGRVVDASGAPVVHAIVRAVDHARWYSRQTVSGADGMFTLDGLGRSFFYVRGESAPSASQTQVVDLSAAESQSIELKLLRSGAIGGTVVDDQGRPCADEAVNSMFRENDSVFSSVTTDANGRFMIEDLPEGVHVLWAGRFSDQDFGMDEVTARTGDTDVLLKKSTFGSVRGEVALQDASQPPKDFLVTIFGTTVGVHRTYRAIGTGVFELDGLRPDAYQLMVNGSEFVDTRLDIKVTANQTTDLGRLVVQRGRSASGQVVDVTGAPASGARLRVGEVRRRVASFTHDEWDVVSDSDGRFTIAGLRDTSQYLIVATHDRGCSRGTELPLTGGAGPLTVVLLPCSSLAGTVADGGKPVSELMVAIGDPEVEMAVTDENGAFAFARVPKGKTAIRVIRSGSFSPVYEGEVEVHTGKPTQARLDIRSAVP